MHLLRHRKIPREHDAYLEEMKMKFAKRMDRFGEGIFSRLAEIKNKRISEGKEVIDLSIGAPNIPPAEHIRKALCEEAMKPENYVYAISDTKKLLDTVADWYKRRYDVELDPDTEICSLLGSQEGPSTSESNQQPRGLQQQAEPCAQGDQQCAGNSTT